MRQSDTNRTRGTIFDLADTDSKASGFFKNIFAWQRTTHFDLKALKKFYKGDRARIMYVLPLWVKSMRKQISELKLFHKNRNWKALRVYAHSVKLTSGFLGIKEIRMLASSLEQNALSECNYKINGDFIKQIEELWTVVEEEINDVVNGF